MFSCFDFMSFLVKLLCFPHAACFLTHQWMDVWGHPEHSKGFDKYGVWISPHPPHLLTERLVGAAWFAPQLCRISSTFRAKICHRSMEISNGFSTQKLCGLAHWVTTSNSLCAQTIVLLLPNKLGLEVKIPHKGPYLDVRLYLWIFSPGFYLISG